MKILAIDSSGLIASAALATEDAVLHTLISENFICTQQYMRPDLIRIQIKLLNTSKKDLNIKSFMIPFGAQENINIARRL